MLTLQIFLNKAGRRRSRRSTKGGKVIFSGREVTILRKDHYVVLENAEVHTCADWDRSLVEKVILTQNYIPTSTAPMSPGFYSWVNDVVKATVDFSPPHGEHLELTISGSFPEEVLRCYRDLRAGKRSPTLSWKKNEEEPAPASDPNP